MSRKRSHDYNDINDEQPSDAAESSKATDGIAELESRRRTSLRTKNAVKYSEMDEEAANSSSLSETGGNKAEAAPATTSNSNLANGANKQAAAESTEKATATVMTTPSAEKSAMLEEQCRIGENEQAKKKQRQAAADNGTKNPKTTIESTNMTPKRGGVNGRAQVNSVTKEKMKNSAEPVQVEVEKLVLIVEIKCKLIYRF
jgi:hypothetical protein